MTGDVFTVDRILSKKDYDHFWLWIASEI